MAEKDNWDRFEIVSKFLGAVILIVIPIIIKYSADNIAQSLERGKLVQSLISDLTQHEAQTRRDIALVTLDAAVQQKKECSILGIWGCKKLEEDPIVDVAIILLHDLLSGVSQTGKPLVESTTAKTIILRRTNEKFFHKVFDGLALAAKSTSLQVPDQTPELKEINSKANSSAILANIQPSPKDESTDPSLSGVRLVYIHYRSDKAQALKLQTYLKDNGVLAPGIEQVQGIKQNDIRYSNETDKQIAERFKDNLENLVKDKTRMFEKLIDLSTVGYKVPSGQFEIWLKD